MVYRHIFCSDGGEEVLQLVLPSALRKEVLAQVHQQHGHQGGERTVELLHARCYWPGMAADVVRWCQECDRCQLAKDIPHTTRTYMGHLLASQPNEVLALDFTILEPSASGVENVLVMTDVFTKFTVAIITRDLVLWLRCWYPNGSIGLGCLPGSIWIRAEASSPCFSTSFVTFMVSGSHGLLHATLLVMASASGLTALYMAFCAPCLLLGKGIGCPASHICCFVIIRPPTRRLEKVPTS